DRQRRPRLHDGGDGRHHAVQAGRVFEELAAELQDRRRLHHSPHRPVVWSRPSMTFMFWTAWPDAPFSRLSITDTSTARPDGSTRQPMSQKLVCATCLISGSVDPTRRTNVSPPKVSL